MLKKGSKKPVKTSWESSGKWYHSSVGEEGHYYHKQIILPGVLKLLELKQPDPKISILDLACGQGVLSRQLPKEVFYTGIDASPLLIQEAKALNRNPDHSFLVGDITKPLPLEKNRQFSHATIILALQNIEHPEKVFQHISPYLKEGGKWIIVLNHPCFRIPRQSSWQVDHEKKIQYRRLDRYASSLKIPIMTHPSKQQESPTTWTFHHSLATYSQWLHESGFVIEQLLEWCSDKVSEGAAAKMENRSREEFPLFLTIVAKKVTL